MRGISGREILLVAGAIGAFALLKQQQRPAPATPSPQAPAPTAYTALAAPGVGGSPVFPSIGAGAAGGPFFGAAMGGTYAGVGQTNGQGYGVLAVPNIPNLYGWQGASPLAYKAAGR